MDILNITSKSVLTKDHRFSHNLEISGVNNEKIYNRVYESINQFISGETNTVGCVKLNANKADNVGTLTMLFKSCQHFIINNPYQKDMRFLSGIKKLIRLDLIKYDPKLDLTHVLDSKLIHFLKINVEDINILNAICQSLPSKLKIFQLNCCGKSFNYVLPLLHINNIEIRNVVDTNIVLTSCNSINFISLNNAEINISKCMTIGFNNCLIDYNKVRITDTTILESLSFVEIFEQSQLNFISTISGLKHLYISILTKNDTIDFSVINKCTMLEEIHFSKTKCNLLELSMSVDHAIYHGTKIYYRGQVKKNSNLIPPWLT